MLWTTRDRGNANARGGGGRGGTGSGDAGDGGGGGGGQRQVGPGVNVLDQWAPLGDYTVTLEVSGKTAMQKAQIAKMQGWSIGATPQVIKSLQGTNSSAQ